MAKTIDRQRFLLEIRLIMAVSALSQSSELLGESGDDARILEAPIDRLCKSFRKANDINDMQPMLLEQIAHFFEHYKDLDEG